MIFSGKWIDTVILGDVTQIQKEKYHTFIFYLFLDAIFNLQICGFYSEYPQRSGI